MKKSCHGRLSEDILNVTYLSNGKILYCKTSMQEDIKQTRKKGKYS